MCKRTHFVMVREVIVRDGDGSGCMDDIDQTIERVRERAMVDPDVGGSKNAYGITITPSPMSQVCWSAPN